MGRRDEVEVILLLTEETTMPIFRIMQTVTTYYDIEADTVASAFTKPWEEGDKVDQFDRRRHPHLLRLLRGHRWPHGLLRRLLDGTAHLREL